MCGICGEIALGGRSALLESVVATRDALGRRGPDGSGLWCDSRMRVALGHTRLSIIDLSEGGSQPMCSEDGRVVITFNGEIYNYRELREELIAQNVRFASASDTEVILRLYQCGGKPALTRLRGMYAFAIWDGIRECLLLARDPLGIKPLYIWNHNARLRFASQVRALIAGSKEMPAVSPAGSVGFFLWGNVPEPFTIYQDIEPLEPGCITEIHLDGGRSIQRIATVPDILTAVALPGRPCAGTERFRTAFDDAIKRHLVADVPLGLFLSAGIDSASVAAAVSRLNGGDLTTVTLGFEEFRNTPRDEVPGAEQIATTFHTRHHTIWLTRTEVQRRLSDFFAAMDQPTIDGLNTFLVSGETARLGLKVALSGAGGDELVGGYSSFRQIPNAVRLFGFARVFPRIARATRSLLAPLGSTTKWHKIAGLLEYGSTFERSYLLSRSLMMPWQIAGVFRRDFFEEGWRALDPVARIEPLLQSLSHPHQRVSALETSLYLRNQLLRDADWAGMAHGLEIRVPFVDVDLYRSVAALRSSGTPISKSLLTATLQDHLPESLITRRKTGFSIPTPARAHFHAMRSGARPWPLEVFRGYLENSQTLTDILRV